MKRFIYTREMLDFIESSFKMGVSDVTKKFNDQFGLDKTEKQIQGCISNHKFTCGRRGELLKGRLRKYTNEQKAWIEKHYKGKTINELHALFNKRFKKDYTIKSIRAFVKNHGIKSGRTGQFKKGQVSWNKGKEGFMGANKTSFKKGQASWNKKPLGWERTTKDGAIMVKVAEPNKFRLKNRVVWEKHNGPIPKDHVVLFRDGDPSNCDIDNLTLLSRSELLSLNKMDHKTAPIELKPIIRNLARIQAQVSKRADNHA